MRLKCDVDVVNRILPSMNLKKPSRGTHAQLSIGKKPQSDGKEGVVFLMMCTSKDRNGTKYIVKDNIAQIFGRFIQDGKATIRFRDPEQDLCISKADALQLKNFLSILKLAAQGKSVENITLSTLAPASAKNVEKPRTKMVITTKKDYPLTTSFPLCLEQLYISQCRLKRIDTRIFQLKKLEVLDLRENVLETLPDDLAKLTKLRELTLCNNQITNIPAAVCLKENLCQNLCLLDVSYNCLQVLPLQICELQNLLNLKVDFNKLESLPPTIGRMKRLKYFSASNNQIKTLPSGFMRLRLEALDLFGNPFPSTVEEPISDRQWDAPSLVECCARLIRKHRVPYNEDILHTHLCRYLESARLCWCGGYCFQDCVKYTANMSLKSLAPTVSAVNMNGQTDVPVLSFLCSPQCLSRFKKNPYAYWKK